jgi:hypothetical protein
MEPAQSNTEQRHPEIKICQTNTLVLISIMEPDVSEDDIYVQIEPKHISVDITRHDLGNPLIAGVLYGQVEKEHCRVRIKKDSVLIKLRKTVTGRWRSILQDVTPVSPKQKPTPETRIRPIKTTRDTDPIEPSLRHDLPREKEQSAISVDVYRGVDTLETIDASESTVFSTLESIKKFHQSLFGALIGSTAIQEANTDYTDDESRNEANFIDGSFDEQVPLEP